MAETEEQRADRLRRKEERRARNAAAARETWAALARERMALEGAAGLALYGLPLRGTWRRAVAVVDEATRALGGWRCSVCGRVPTGIALPQLAERCRRAGKCPECGGC